MQRSTKIVATLGPASSEREVLARMIAAGVDVVRMNFSHGTREDHIGRAELVRDVSRELRRTVGLMVDLQGPKIRIGKFEQGKIRLEKGDPFILDADCGMGNQERVGLDYKELPRDVRPSDVLLLDDGRIVLDVREVQGSQIRTVVRHGGEVSNNKGINRQGGGLTAPALTAKDMDDIKTAAQLKADFLAVSFPKSGSDMYMARELMRAAGGQALLIAKIERAEAITALKEIIDASDAIMVARGDLAVEVGDAAVPAMQKRMIRLAREMNKLTITATQMMESMIIEPGAYSRRGVGRGQRGAGRHRRGHAVGRDRQRQVPGGDGGSDGACVPGGGEVQRSDARSRISEPGVHARGPVDRHGRAVHGLSLEGEGHRRTHAIRLDRAVDVAAELRCADLRADAGGVYPLQAFPVPRRLSADAAVHGG